MYQTFNRSFRFSSRNFVNIIDNGALDYVERRKFSHQFVRYFANKKDERSSVLFVSGRHASSNFKVVSPDISTESIERRRELLEKVLMMKNVKISLEKMKQDLIKYNKLKIKADKIRQEKSKVKTDLKAKKESSDSGDGDEEQSKVNRLNSELAVINKEMWEIEDKSVMQYLKLSNFDKFTGLEDKEVIELKSSLSESTSSILTYKKLMQDNQLIEFSKNSHTAYYLQSDLAKLELRLSWYVQQFLLENEFDQFSNPDFVKTLGVEGVDGDPVGADLLNLKATQDFGDRESLNAMYLVGGASKYPFVSYFARHFIANPQVLPLKMFSIGRHYCPVPREDPRDLLSTQQSTAVNFMIVAGSRDEMEELLSSTTDMLAQLLKEFGHLKVIEKGASSLSQSEETRFSFQLRLPASKQFVEVARISVENDYFSRRLMFKQRLENSFSNLYTLTGSIMNITRMLPVLMENFQQDGRPDFQKITRLLDDESHL